MHALRVNNVAWNCIVKAPIKSELTIIAIILLANNIFFHLSL